MPPANIRIPKYRIGFLKKLRLSLLNEKAKAHTNSQKTRFPPVSIRIKAKALSDADFIVVLFPSAKY